MKTPTRHLLVALASRAGAPVRGERAPHAAPRRPQPGGARPAARAGPARRRHLRLRHEAGGQALPAPPPSPCRRDRRPRHLARSAARTGPRPTRGGSSVRLLQRRLGIAADGVFGPGTQARAQALPARARADGRRRRRPRHVGRARACAATTRSSRRGAAIAAHRSATSHRASRGERRAAAAAPPGHRRRRRLRPRHRAGAAQLPARSRPHGRRRRGPGDMGARSACAATIRSCTAGHVARAAAASA